MKKNTIIAGTFLLLLVVLCVVFYPKAEKEQQSSAQKIVLTDETQDNSTSKIVVNKKRKDNVSELKASFDIVRVEEDGSMIAAGKGEKGTVISLMDGESLLTRFTVNEDGEWIYIPSEPLVAGEHEIWLQDDSMNSREQSEIVVVNVPESQNTDQVLAVIVSPDAEDVDVLQAPEAQIPVDIDIRSVNYVNNAFVIRGTVSSLGRINVYLDNLFLGDVQAEQTDWSLRVSKRLDAGKKYLIRADKVDLNGKVLSRIEVPFEMEKGLEKSKRRNVRIVKGDCLWAIAKQLYGSGFAYVTIYQANKNQIKDPNLIYPNQVFVLPAQYKK